MVRVSAKGGDVLKKGLRHIKIRRATTAATTGSFESRSPECLCMKFFPETEPLGVVTVKVAISRSPPRLSTRACTPERSAPLFPARDRSELPNHAHPTIKNNPSKTSPMSDNCGEGFHSRRTTRTAVEKDRRPIRLCAALCN